MKNVITYRKLEFFLLSDLKVKKFEAQFQNEVFTANTISSLFTILPILSYDSKSLRRIHPATYFNLK